MDNLYYVQNLQAHLQNDFRLKFGDTELTDGLAEPRLNYVIILLNFCIDLTKASDMWYNLLDFWELVDRLQHLDLVAGHFAVT